MSRVFVDTNVLFPFSVMDVMLALTEDSVHEVPESDYAHLVVDMPGGDPDDRLHMAAAVAGGAETIVTWNRADFPAGALVTKVCGFAIQTSTSALCSTRGRKRWPRRSFDWRERNAAHP